MFFQRGIFAPPRFLETCFNSAPKIGACMCKNSVINATQPCDRYFSNKKVCLKKVKIGFKKICVLHQYVYDLLPNEIVYKLRDSILFLHSA